MPARTNFNAECEQSRQPLIGLHWIILHRTLLNVSGGVRLRSHTAKSRAQVVSHTVQILQSKIFFSEPILLTV